ncbi:MAG: hypothetical protein K9H64_17895 [Bacteroidales bacterium]|nr:hypothetical protein [Bacteroidales bacterium]MCF8457894.1 hypothetical protein [Bacteroidales bacterium]
MLEIKFTVTPEIFEEFQQAKKFKEKELGVPISDDVAFYLVLMEISHKWNQQSKNFKEVVTL